MPTILPSQVRIPRTSHTLLYGIILYYNCHCVEERTKINKKRPGLAPFLMRHRTVCSAQWKEQLLANQRYAVQIQSLEILFKNLIVNSNEKNGRKDENKKRPGIAHF